MSRNFIKGHEAPKGHRINKFNDITINGDFAYCESHKFLYNTEVEEEKLYNAQPCYYTDNRFYDGYHNSYKQTMLHWTRFHDISLKACIRKVMETRNIPKGTEIRFGKSWYVRRVKWSNGFGFKVKKENKFEPQYEINMKGYSKNFNTCERSKELTDTLRANGFIVYVNSKNPSFLSSLISTAAAHVGKQVDVDNDEGETATAYGYGKKIGFSSKNNTLFGYSNGCDSILWDRFGEFCKWSRCNEISKTTSIEEIIEILKQKDDV
jgi:hypothetical protein